MHNLGLASSVLACWLSLTFSPALARAQTTDFPTISQRQYTGGSARVTVSGSGTIDQEIPLNAAASYSDGEVTWLQFGISGSETPNSLITYGEMKEIGIAVSKGKFIATGGIMPGEKTECSGTVEVSETEISGDYTCSGVVSHDPVGGTGKVDMKVRFTAKS